MQDTNQTRYETGHPICDAWRFLCDASYAVLPRDAAHQLGEFQKNIWGALGWLAEKQIDLIDEAVRGGDRLREEWRERCRTNRSTGSTTTNGYTPPGDTQPESI
jgi:hypothetical protein